MVRLIGGHVVVSVFAGYFSFDREQIANRLYDCLSNVADLCSQLLDEAVEEVPRAGLDADMFVVHKSYKILEDLRDVALVILKDSAVPDTDLHVL